MLAKKIALAFGIAIVFPSMIHFGVGVVNKNPSWQEYQVEDYYEKYQNATPEEKEKLSKDKKQLAKERKDQTKRFQMTLFFVAVPLGLIVLILGAFLPFRAIGAGLMFAGIFSICDGYFNYWSEISDILKFISSFCAFITLVIIGLLKIEQKNT